VNRNFGATLEGVTQYMFGCILGSVNGYVAHVLLGSDAVQMSIYAFCSMFAITAVVMLAYYVFPETTDPNYWLNVIVSFAIGCGIALLCLVLPFPRFALPMAHHRVAYAAALNAQVLCGRAFYPVYCLLFDIHKCVLGVRYDVF
jgi:uncharacterized membrane protein YgaE (UPF0421/DUF939 family)